MIPIRRWVELSKMAEAALKRGDLKTIDLINQDEELRSANCQFLIRDEKLWVGTLDSVEQPPAEVDSTLSH